MKPFDQMQPADRIASAKSTMEKVVDHFLYSVELRENNAIIVYSPTLTDQIPASHAASAFAVFQRGLRRMRPGSGRAAPCGANGI
ncbi:hypothetical protein WOC76_13010 [Methylocystis sp. IM3]|uniref:hypothetical protein n=1 Tax=unclassified Methylocystis TaxID=2625913 RepID=UPI0030F80617